MWLSLDVGNKLKSEYGLVENQRLRLPDADWALNQLPKDLSLKEHPFCAELESTLNALGGARLARGFIKIQNACTFRYVWDDKQVNLLDDPINSLAYYNCPRGDVFIGGYRRSLYAYSFPCYGVTPLKDKSGMLPTFYSQSQLKEFLQAETRNVIFFRNRQIGPLRKAVSDEIFNVLRS